MPDYSGLEGQPLDDREIRMLQLYADGYNTFEVADIMHYSLSTLEQKIARRIYTKLDLEGNTQGKRLLAVVYAMRNRLIT